MAYSLKEQEGRRQKLLAVVQFILLYTFQCLPALLSHLLQALYRYVLNINFHSGHSIEQ